MKDVPWISFWGSESFHPVISVCMQVVKVYDHKKELMLALKIIRNKKRFHHQALVEIKILEHLMIKVRTLSCECRLC